jgi:hypothetical protein
MRLSNTVFKAAFAALCLTIAACGGTTSGDSRPAASTSAIVRSTVKPATSVDSVTGTTIPSATQITDVGGSVWTVSSGVIYENGALAGYSNAVKLLLYDNEFIYQENAAGGWWSWNGTTWVSSADPRKISSPNGATIPMDSQITDGSGNVWAVSGGVIYENGALAGYSNAVTLLLYDNNKIYQENSAGGWWSWTNGTWTGSSDPRLGAASPSGTTIPAVTQIIDSSGNVWTVSGGIVYENGSAAGYSNGVKTLVYDDNKIYQENAAGGWWSWSGSTWASSGDPIAVPPSSPAPPSGPVTPTIAGSPPTTDSAGQAFSFVPTTTNPGGGALSFSITNMPAWASFSTTTGALTGTPSGAQAGVYSNILISVSSGGVSASLAPFSITVTTGSATLSWTAPTENTNGTPLMNLAGYTIYYGTSLGALTQTIQVPNPSAITYSVGNLSAGTYYFAVTAYTSSGTQSTQSAIGSKTIL